MAAPTAVAAKIGIGTNGTTKKNKATSQNLGASTLYGLANKKASSATGTSAGESPYAALWSNYEQRQKAALDEGNRAIQQQTDYSIGEIDQTAKNSSTAAERAYLAGQKALPAQMAKLGLSGTGAAESSQISANNAYGQNLNNIQTQRNADIAAARQAAMQQQSAAYQNYLSTMAGNYLTNGQNEINYNYQTGRDAIEDSRYADETAYARNQSTAEALAAFGDYSGYAALGWTPAQIRAAEKQWKKANSKSSGGGRRSGGGGGSYAYGEYGGTLAGNGTAGSSKQSAVTDNGKAYLTYYRADGSDRTVNEGYNAYRNAAKLKQKNKTDENTKKLLVR